MRHISRPLIATLALALGMTALAVTATPRAQQAGARKKLLFLTHPGLYKHPSLEFAEKAVAEWGPANGFDGTSLEGYKQTTRTIDLTALTPAYLNQFDGLMMMTNGNLPIPAETKKAIVDFVRNGKAIIGTHCATLTFYDYPEFGEMLGGYYLRSIIPTDQVGKKMGVLKVEDRTHPATKALGARWAVGEEFYLLGPEVWSESKPTENRSQVGNLPIPIAFTRDRVHVLLSLDTEQTDISDLPLLKKGGDYPQAWTREFGKGRVFYTTLGHREDIWGNDSMFKAHVVSGIRWALGLEN